MGHMLGARAMPLCVDHALKARAMPFFGHTNVFRLIFGTPRGNYGKVGVVFEVLRPSRRVCDVLFYQNRLLFSWNHASISRDKH